MLEITIIPNTPIIVVTNNVVLSPEPATPFLMTTENGENLFTMSTTLIYYWSPEYGAFISGN
jgi:hypothetical protein